MGPKIELKFTLESYWDGKSSIEDLQNVAATHYDQVLDIITMLGLFLLDTIGLVLKLILIHISPWLEQLCPLWK